MSGACRYSLSENASDREAATLAARENRADALDGINLTAENDEVVNILISLAQRDTMNRSRRFANMLVDEMGRQTQLVPRPHRSAGFAVLTAPDIPSVLIELGYLSSRRMPSCWGKRNIADVWRVPFSRASTGILPQGPV